MKEVTLKIPENKLVFFLELIRQLGYEISEEVDISEEHKEMVRNRIKTSKPEELVPWKEARKQFKFKDKA